GVAGGDMTRTLTTFDSDGKGSPWPRSGKLDIGGLAEFLKSLIEEILKANKLAEGRRYNFCNYIILLLF
ncbi:hypothetical protein G4B88_029878, partial [Cannabis sativa]